MCRAAGVKVPPENTISMRLASGLILAGVHQPMSTDSASALNGYDH
jgi:hypothetical protein